MINLFAHRGFWANQNLQNSITSLDAAHENGFCGLEFDVWYIEKKLIISHDKPRLDEDRPSFANYLKYGNEFYYWIDCKNLDLKNCHEVFLLMKAEFERQKIDMNKIYIAPFITNYQIAKDVLCAARKVFGDKIKFAAICEYEEEIPALLEFIKTEQISYLSISYKILSLDLIKKIPQVEIFTWTVNDLTKIAEFENCGIKNFITDVITPKIYENHQYRPQGAS